MSVISYSYNLGDFVKDFYELSMTLISYELTFPEFHFETEAKVDFPSACI